MLVSYIKIFLVELYAERVVPVPTLQAILGLLVTVLVAEAFFLRFTRSFPALLALVRKTVDATHISLQSHSHHVVFVGIEPIDEIFCPSFRC